ncbi:MAG: F0F1 ATP synthase subunit epsilon [Planctomycetota bacterium]|nr:F0F1 ATP synthase subunit epsilon [Planctomycetota bacterium]
MAQTTFRCRLVTPTASLVDDRVLYASLPAWDGLMGVMPGRAAMLARLGLGELRLDFPDTAQTKGGSRSYFIDGGFVRMAGDELTILAEKATPVEELNAADAEKELRTAAAKTVPAGAKDAVAAQESIDNDRQRARVKVHLARGTSGKGI